MYYTRDFIERVRQADLLNCFPDAVQKGKQYKCDCPQCGYALGLEIYHDRKRQRHSAKCFHCGLFLSNPIDAVKAINNWHTNDRFPQVIEEAARRCNIYY